MSKVIYKYRLYVLLILLILVLGGGYYYVIKLSQKETINNNAGDAFLKPGLTPETVQTPEPPTAESLPVSFLIENFPFQTQAPLVNWDALHEEACEEASIILVAYYLMNKSLSVDTMEQEIQNLVAWENKNWNGVVDINAEQAGQLAKANYGLDYQTIKNSNLAELKQQIATGHPVIVPAAGRLLGNPNFRGEGPVYHMVVAIGYDAQNIIVQDVGTRNGNQYEYNQKIFENAWHDWAGSPENITDGAKNILILTNQE